MAFHVTQCPDCDSTFNTSARLLESAQGRVRCGACLAVFDAIENFVDQAQNQEGQAGEESVFVGNNPLDYFDPSRFLTRAALTEKEEHGVTAEESEVEDGEHVSENGEFTLERQTVDSDDSAIESPAQQQFDQDFFAAVADELQQSSELPEPQEPAKLESSDSYPLDEMTAQADDQPPDDAQEQVTEFEIFPATEPDETLQQRIILCH